MQKNASLNMDAFSDGQIGSKLWLCDSVEKYFENLESFESVWIYGAWYGVLAFIMFSRGKYSIKK